MSAKGSSPLRKRGEKWEMGKEICVEWVDERSGAYESLAAALAGRKQEITIWAETTRREMRMPSRIHISITPGYMTTKRTRWLDNHFQVKQCAIVWFCPKRIGISCFARCLDLQVSHQMDDFPQNCAYPRCSRS